MCYHLVHVIINIWIPRDHFKLRYPYLKVQFQFFWNLNLYWIGFGLSVLLEKKRQKTKESFSDFIRTKALTLALFNTIPWQPPKNTSEFSVESSFVGSLLCRSCQIRKVNLVPPADVTMEARGRMMKRASW